MKLYPLHVMDFQEMFPTDEAYFGYLCLVKWPEGFICSQCGHKEYWHIKPYMIRCRGCRKKISVTAGTIFQDTHLPLRIVFQAMWYVICQKQGVSALSLQSILGVGSYETTWAWLHKLRRAMVRPGRDRLSGIVEVDETLIGGEKTGKRGRGAEGRELVLVIVENNHQRVGRIRLKHIKDASGETLESAVTELVESGSTIRTDGWRGYTGLKKLGFEHITISHSEATPGEDPTPLVHHVASLLKRWLLGTHQGGQSFSYLHYYLDEFTFRFNRRTSKSRGQLFLRLMQQALQTDPAPISTLKAT